MVNQVLTLKRKRKLTEEQKEAKAFFNRMTERKIKNSNSSCKTSREF